jgi:hypothetical protein
MANTLDKNGLAYARDSGSCARNGVEVQVLSSAPRIEVVRESNWGPFGRLDFYLHWSVSATEPPRPSILRMARYPPEGSQNPDVWLESTSALAEAREVHSQRILRMLHP